MSHILYVLIATKPKEIKEQERCETLDKGCEEFEKTDAKVQRRGQLVISQ